MTNQHVKMRWERSTLLDGRTTFLLMLAECRKHRRKAVEEDWIDQRGRGSGGEGRREKVNEER